jgi:hypothetical protein
VEPCTSSHLSRSTADRSTFFSVRSRDKNRGYDGVIAIGIGLKSWAFLVGVGYCCLDRFKLGGVGNMGEKARLAKEETVVDPERQSLAHLIPSLLSLLSQALTLLDLLQTMHSPLDLFRSSCPWSALLSSAGWPLLRETFWLRDVSFC